LCQTTTTTTTPGDPKHGNQPDIHRNNNNTQQQKHNNGGAEHASICQELVATENNLPSTPHIIIVPKHCTLATVTFFAWSMPGNPERYMLS
jgi:hypothetical protein